MKNIPKLLRAKCSEARANTNTGGGKRISALQSVHSTLSNQRVARASPQRDRLHVRRRTLTLPHSRPRRRKLDLRCASWLSRPDQASRASTKNAAAPIFPWTRLNVPQFFQARAGNRTSPAATPPARLQRQTLGSAAPPDQTLQGRAETF
eukprot:3264009-Pleurochrysis_carterae.AAC.3